MLKYCALLIAAKNIFFLKHKIGFWQLDDTHIEPNIADFNFLHTEMQKLVEVGFGQEQIKTGNYYQALILKIGIDIWNEIESKLKPRRGEPIFDLAAWLMFTSKNIQ